MADRSLDVLRRRIAVLKSFQSQLRWPVLDKFEAFGQTYRLPYRSTCKPEIDVPDQLLRYLAGFFDGDGCVSSDRSCCHLSVSQSCRNAEILKLFQQTFGGGIYVDAPGQGLRRPCLKWTVTGSAANDVAAKLARNAVVKRGQLNLAACWPHEKQHQRDAKVQLASLKLQQSEPHLACSWAYVAGFFDAEGCVKTRTRRAGIMLSVTQKDRNVLSWIDNFWRADLDLASSWVLHNNGITEVSVNSGCGVHLLLRRLLSNKLLVKRPQALLGLSLGSVRYQDLRYSIQKLSGNQSRYQSLTEDGCQRSKAIENVQCSIRRRLITGREEEAAQLQNKLEALRQEHKLLNAAAVYNTVLRDIRALLQRGAVAR